jgi:3-dehydroquinate dehydratase
VFENTKKPLGARIIGIVTSSNRNDPEMWQALAQCDIAEFRGDLWEPVHIVPELLSFRQECIRRYGALKETIFTLRLKRDGGNWPDQERQ